MSTEDTLGMDGLTYEEIEALKALDDDPNATQGELEDKTAATELAASKAGETGADDGKAKTTPAGADAGTAAAIDDAAAAAAPAVADHAQPAAATEPSATPGAPLYVATAPADAEAKLAEIGTKKADLRKQYDDGDVTFEDYEAQKDTLVKQEREIERQVDKAEIAVEMEEQRRKNQWANDCETFMTTPEHKALYDGEANKEAFGHLNETIIAFAKMPMYGKLSGPQLLDKAHRHIMAERGTPVAAPAAAAAPAVAKPAVPKPALPPNIASLPSASSNDPGEGRFAGLDRLATTNTEAYEAALAKLSPAEQDAYLAA